MNKLLCLTALSAIVVATVFGAEFWEEKSPDSWDPKQCQEILNDSPWVETVSFSRVNWYTDSMRGGRGTVTVENEEFGSTSGGQSGSGGASGSPGQERQVTQFLRITLASAAPVRLASARMQALMQPGSVTETLDSIAAMEPPNIAIQVSYYSRPVGQNWVRDIDSFLRQVTLPTLQNSTYLAAEKHNIHVPVSHYVPSSENMPAAIFVFPRFNENGQPHFSGKEKEIVFHTELKLTQFGGSRDQVVDVDFEPKKLTFNGKFSF
ncbi:MAG: hypothetical protein ACRD1R_12065 [Acidobacteriota bacterium]